MLIRSGYLSASFVLTMCIKKAIIADTEELTKLVNSAYRGESSKTGWTSEAHLLDDTRIDDLEMFSYLQDNRITILKYLDDNEVIKGCVYLEPKEGKLYLGMLTVSPLVQAQGIGRQLLEAAEKHAKKNHLAAIFMTVITSRYELIAWYGRRGFNATGEMRPFPVHEKFGIKKQPLELMVMEKKVN